VEGLKMRKLVIIILLSILMFLSFFIPAQTRDLKLVDLDSINILEENYLELTVDNKPAGFTVVKQDGILYVDPGFFTSFFGITLETISEQIEYAGKFYDRPEIETLYVPLFPVLKTLGFRYTYSPLYGKEIIRIRTDNGFKIYDPSIYANTISPSRSPGNLPGLGEANYGNTPYTPPGQLDENGFSENGYPVVNSVGPGSPGCGSGG